MTVQTTLEQRVRRTIEVLRDDLRVAAAQFGQLRHERFISQLPVTRNGWLAFAKANSSTKTWEEWRLDGSGGWMGRFYGKADGTQELTEIGKHFAELAGCSLLDIVHDFAVLDATPLLRVVPEVWDWEPSEHTHDNGCVLDTEPFLGMWSEASEGECRYPKHPLVKSLDCGVFRACCVALEMLLTPEAFFIWRPFCEDDVPLTISQIVENWHRPVWAAPQQESSTFTPISPATENEVAPFLYRREADFWHIRFTDGKVSEESKFSLTKPFERYAKLLFSPHKVIPSIHFDLSSSIDGIAMISEDEAIQAFSDDGKKGWSDGGITPTELTADEVEELKQAQEELRHQIDTEEDPKRRKGLLGVYWRNERTLFVQSNSDGLKNYAETAHRKVKKSLKVEGLNKIRQKMPRLADHLDAFVEAEGFGYAYRPLGQIHWAT